MRRIFTVLFTLIMASPVWAVDSYRYLHVTIDTPWTIFIILLPLVLAPFILMIILYWRYAIKKSREKKVLDNSKSESGQPRN